MRRRRRLALQVIAFCLIAGVVGVVAAHFVKSPAERAAASAAPSATQLTAVVERKVVTNDIVARGTVKAAGSVDFTPSDAFGADVTTLTRKPMAAGDEVDPGDVIVEVSGRPTFALAGALPAYRSLKKGDKGQDVAQLQAALRALGHGTGGDATGKFGSGTAVALQGLYRSDGYTVAKAGDTVTLPRSEVVYVPRFPARLEKLAGKVGGEISSPTAVISYGALNIRAQIDPTDAALLRRGQKAAVSNGGDPRSGTVGVVPAVPTIGDDGAYYSVPITPRTKLPASWNGADVEIDITAASTKGPVLVVPLSAISTSADGSTSVTRVEGAGSTVVRVRAGVTANGFVEVAATDGTLRAGDRVVVGAR